MFFTDDQNDLGDCGCTGFSGCATSCSPCNQPIQFIKGNTFSLAATFSLNGAPVNITGAVITMVAKVAPLVPDSDAIFTLSTGTGEIVITDPTMGQFSVVIPSSATLNVPMSSFPCVYDITVTIGSARYTIFRGELSLLINVTDN